MDNLGDAYAIAVADHDAHVGELVADSISADLRARKVFTATRIQMESAMAFFNWAAVAVGVVLALHHVAAAGVVYLILFYATFVGTSLEESFEFIRLMSRAIGRCAKFAGIALTQPDIVDAPEAPELARLQARIERGAQVVAVLLLIGAGAMAVARYL